MDTTERERRAEGRENNPDWRKLTVLESGVGLYFDLSRAHARQAGLGHRKGAP